MKYSIFILTYFLALCLSELRGQQLQKVAFYNVENLFDTIDGPNDDAEFLPDSEKLWNSEKYSKKIDCIREVMATLQMPMIMGFCEIENKTVLQDLIGKDKRYAIVHYESLDARGIDVGVIYRKDLLKLKSSGFIRFVLPNDSVPTSRDILWAKLSYKRDNLYILVNHWPSRRGGEEQSAPRRYQAALQAKHFIDSIQSSEPKAKIIFMGDLNDYPTDAAPQLIASTLMPQINKLSNTFGGSYNYKSQWDILDHIMVSKSCFQGKFQVMENSGKILSENYLLTEYKGQVVPKRTYAGNTYLDGYSDHLPVSIDVILHP